ncbi:phage FluMu gp28-like protein [Paucimonas lemoignei]|uniref:Phage FluMu gp28-like protein n=1 Tax=Paucimonas lemoignei TaxID=29443 RepID=A0A4R3I1N1_PAULE|nr:terminase family protein [Paucimonas lemoignei]TCS38515.1 phage FluMu gp28-like protein [Paucimonas lemoignei]
MTDAVLLPYQQKWLADTSPVRVCEKSRRVGLSWGEAAGSALEAAAEHGQDTWYIGYNKDMAQEFIRDCAFWAKHYNLAASEMEEEVIKDEERDILTFRINFASGFRVTALSSSPSNLRGKQGRVIIDEAAFHPNLKELLKAAFALLIWGGSVSVISTHNGVDNPFNELIEDIRAGKKPYSLHRIEFDEAVRQGLCRRVFLATKREWSPAAEAAWCEEIRAIYRPNDAEELDVTPSQSGGAYMSRALIESRMDASAPVIRLTCPEGFEQRSDAERRAYVDGWIEQNLAPLVSALPKNLRSFYGMDFARNGDLSVVTPLLEEQSLRCRAPFMIEMRNVPFKQQEQVVFWLADRLPRFSGAAHDARGNGQYLAEVAMQRYGAAMVHQVMLTREFYRENMPKMKAAFEDAEILIPKDADVLADMRAIVVDKGVPKVPDSGHTTGNDGGKRHGDAAISVLLADFASRNPGAVIEFESINDTRIGGAYNDYVRAL